VGIGIQKTNAVIGIPASVISVRYRSKKMPDCMALFRYRTGRGIASFFQSSTGLTGCRTVRHSGSYTVKKTKRYAGPKHLCDQKFRHPHRTIGKIRHPHRSGRWIYVDGGVFLHIYVLALRHAWFF
jgi:hypothetical protein